MAVTQAEVAEIYVATFDRAPDTHGLDYWVASGLTIEQLSSMLLILELHGDVESLSGGRYALIA